MKNNPTVVHCKVCGVDETLHWTEKDNNELINHQMCFNCNFWREKVEWKTAEHPQVAIIDGVHYYWNEPNNNPIRGFSGRKFTIQYNDGRVVETNDLWCQGDIPAGHWRTLLPDNAKFI